MTPDQTWTNNIFAITLFAEDLPAAKAFYQRVFGLPVHFEGDTSVVFQMGTTLINLLEIGQADELITPAQAADSTAGVRAVYTLQVDDVDAWCAELSARGVSLLNGPMDRPWGIRTASFQDPMGTVWEIAHDL
jgi:catechol 2,3-dioxygenase-like lactoylglutathione lyase family enzyme